MKCRSFLSFSAAGLLMAGTFAACGGSGGPGGTTGGGTCTTPSTANPTSVFADSTIATSTMVVQPSPSPATMVIGQQGDIEAPCLQGDFDFAFFNTSANKANALGRLLALLVTLDTKSDVTTAGICPDGKKPSLIQGAINQSINGGKLALKMTLTSKDSTYTSDTCAGLVVQGAMGSPPVGGGAATNLTGSISGGTFTSSSPASGDVQLTIGLPLLPGAAPIALPLHAVQITFKPGTGNAKFTGQINGALTVTDLKTSLIPALLGLIHGLSAGTLATVLPILDVGNNGTATCAPPGAGLCTAGTMACADPDGTCQYAGDGTVGECEVLCSEVGNLLVPDIEIYAPGTTTYGPVTTPVKANLDSLSIGVGFSAQ